MHLKPSWIKLVFIPVLTVNTSKLKALLSRFKASKMKIIREIGKGEIWNLSVNRGRRFSETIRVTTSLDLFSRLELLNRTIRLWMSAHKLLRANITDVDSKKYFIRDERFAEDLTWTKDNSDLSNVHYLVIDSNKLGSVEDKNSCFKDISMLVCERELAFAPDISSQLLWSLVFLEIPKLSSNDDTKEYDITLVINHIISEGKNGHMLLLQLLDLIENQWNMNEVEQSNQKPMKEVKLELNPDNMYFDNIDADKLYDQTFEKLPVVFKENYIELSEEKRCPSRPYKWLENLTDEWIYKLKQLEDLIQRREWIRLGELVRQNELICDQNRGFTLSREETSRLVDKCRMEKTSVTLAIINLLAYAFRKLSYSLKQDTNNETPAQALVMFPVTLRQFKPFLEGYEPSAEFVDHLSMGLYIAPAILPIKPLRASMLEKADEFWEGCRVNSQQLRKMIENRELCRPIEPREKIPNEADWSFVVSNFGVIPEKLPAKYALSDQTKFSITNVHSDNSVDTDNFWEMGPIVLFSSTCNGRMNLSFTYSSFIFNHSQADQMIEYFFDFFQKFIDSKVSIRGL